MRGNTERQFHTSRGDALTLITNDRVELRRRNFSLLIGELPKRPQPIEAVRNFERARSTSAEKFFQIEDAAIAVSRPESVIRYIGRHATIAFERLTVRPCPMEQLDETLDIEQDFQNNADKQQRRMKEYIRAKDPRGLQLVRDTATAHIAALHRIEQTAAHHQMQFTIGERGQRA